MTNRKSSFGNLTGKTGIYAIVILFTACIFASGFVRVQNHLIVGSFQFEPLSASAQCTGGGNANEPFLLPEGFTQRIVASQPQFPDVPDMNTLNQTGVQAGRFLYRTHETSSNGAVSVTDLVTGETHILAQRSDWERLDGIVWTPWCTILIAEEVNAPAAFPNPDVPQALAGLVYEVDPKTGEQLRVRRSAPNHTKECALILRVTCMESARRIPALSFGLLPTGPAIFRADSSTH
jgi:hypothetical protein